MEKRFQMSAEGIIISILVVLTPSEQEKLECKDLEKTITNIAKDLHVDWAVETSGNACTATVSKTFGPVVGEAQSNVVERAAIAFMSAIRELHIPCEESAYSHETKQDADDVKCGDTVVVFTVGSNAARTIKALRECTSVTLEVAKRYAKNGRLVCSCDKAEEIMENLEVAGATDVHIDEQLTDDLNFCNNVLAEWDETDERAQTTGAIIMCGKRGHDLELPCGRICEDTLKKMFIAYVESL
jgi:ribosomal protein L7/L12